MQRGYADGGLPMTDDAFFRMMFLIVIAPAVPFALYRRVRSHTGEKLDRWQEGALILFGLRLSAIPLLVGVIVWLVKPQWMAWSSVPISPWLRWVGLGVLVLWGVLVVWTFHHLGKNLTDTVVTRKHHTLVTTGPYRFVRHPFYLALAAAILGTCLVARNWLFLAGVVPFFLLVARTRIEEERLIERFGDAYREYMARTGRFLPRVSRPLTPPLGGPMPVRPEPSGGTPTNGSEPPAAPPHCHLL